MKDEGTRFRVRVMCRGQFLATNETCARLLFPGGECENFKTRTFCSAPPVTSRANNTRHSVLSPTGYSVRAPRHVRWCNVFYCRSCRSSRAARSLDAASATIVCGWWRDSRLTVSRIPRVRIASGTRREFSSYAARTNATKTRRRRRETG